MSENITQTDSCKIFGCYNATSQEQVSSEIGSNPKRDGDFFRAIYVATYAFCIDHFVW